MSSDAIRSFTDFVRQLEDGGLHHELTDALRELNAAMNNHVQSYGGKCRGAITLQLDFLLEGGVFEITAKAAVKTPKPKRGKTILWSTPGNDFSRANPRQGDFFDRNAGRLLEGEPIRTV